MDINPLIKESSNLIDKTHNKYALVIDLKMKMSQNNTESSLLQCPFDN